MSRCPGRTRHWFTVYGTPGLPSKVCLCCDAPNPHYERRMSDLFGEMWEAEVAAMEPSPSTPIEQESDEHG